MVFKQTQEQTDNIAGSLKYPIFKIDAAAGAGKTSTLTLISQVLMQKSLYVAYNRSMADDAKTKFGPHVACMTLHSLAYRSVGQPYANKLTRPTGGYRNVAGTGPEIARYYKIKEVKFGEKVIATAGYLGQIIKETVTRFEQSADMELQTFHIPKSHALKLKERYKNFNVKVFENILFKAAKKLWEDRRDTSSDVLATHDTYLKVFQLGRHQLTQYEVIYLDEAQDSNMCTLDIVFNQKHAKIIMVGDARQSLYQWRGAVNAMKNVDCPKGTLTQSFRYGPVIAEIASNVLKNTIKIKGNPANNSKACSYLADGVDEIDVINYKLPYTILFRKNISLIYEAVRLISLGTSVSINIDTKDFVNLLLSAKALYVGDMKKVKHDDLIPYLEWKEFKEDAKNSPSFWRLITLVEKGEADNVIDILLNYRQGDAQVTLTTVNKAKGLEYDQVILGDDFPSNFDDNGRYVGLDETEENLLYVAVTRAIKALKYNETVQEYLDLFDHGGLKPSKGAMRKVHVGV